MVWRRRWSTFDYDGFIGELEQSRLVLDVPPDVTELVECYDSTLSTLLDKFSPQRQIRVKARSSAPWFDADCRHCKAATRKLEKAYRKKPCDQSRSAWERQFSSQRELFQQKLVAYWTATIDAYWSNSKVLWSKLRSLLQPQTDGDTQLSADDFAHYFGAKIDRIRALTASSPSPVINDRSVDQPLSDLAPVTADEVVKILQKSPAKQCKLDRVPTWQACQSCPGSNHRCSLQRVVPATHISCHCKSGIVRPLLQKHTMDLASYRPMSNLSFLSKVVEKVVDGRLSEHIKRHRLLPVRQSAYRPFHSTETAVISIHNDMIGVVDQGDIGALVLLDLSAAFDTVDHSILMDVLRRQFGIDGSALSWMAEFFGNRRQVVYADKTVWSHGATVRCPAGISAWSARVFSIRKRRRWHFPASWSTPSSVRWRHAGSLQRTTWWRSRNCLSARKLYHRHLCLVWRQTFTLQRRQDRATVVWSSVAAASTAISKQ